MIAKQKEREDVLKIKAKRAAQQRSPKATSSYTSRILQCYKDALRQEAKEDRSGQDIRDQLSYLLDKKQLDELNTLLYTAAQAPLYEIDFASTKPIEASLRAKGKFAEADLLGQVCRDRSTREKKDLCFAKMDEITQHNPDYFPSSPLFNISTRAALIDWLESFTLSEQRQILNKLRMIVKTDAIQKCKLIEDERDAKLAMLQTLKQKKTPDVLQSLLMGYIK